MAVREDDSIEAVEAHAQGLLPKIGGGVDHHVLSIAGKQQGGTQTIVVWVRGRANAAVAAEGRNPHRRARTQNGDLYWSRRHGAIR